MLEIIKTLLISLSFAATGAGIAWSVTSQASANPLIADAISTAAVKADRLDMPSTKADRLPAAMASGAGGAVTIVYAKGEAASTVFRAPLVIASAH